MCVCVCVSVCVCVRACAGACVCVCQLYCILSIQQYVIRCLFVCLLLLFVGVFFKCISFHTKSKNSYIITYIKVTITRDILQNAVQHIRQIACIDTMV